jgi:hypothetical protein
MGKEWHESPFIGRWEVTATWDPSDTSIDDIVQKGYFEFDAEGRGEFLLDDVRGQIMDCRLTNMSKRGEPSVEWTWEGASVRDDDTTEMDEETKEAIRQSLARYLVKG